MAIDTIPYPEATNLARPDLAFYPLRIPVSHWQLRHYISTPEPDLLFYASGHDIYCLNTASKKRKHIATLPFEARCTASGYGYVCVGGEDDGHFAAIKLDGSGPRTLDVDSALPIESQAWRSTEGHAAAAVGRRAASVKVERIGEEIVNSISIHRIQDEDAHLDDIVAVLTNNDKTVRVYSLPQSLETTVLDLPFAMNHATVLLDGDVGRCGRLQPGLLLSARDSRDTTTDSQAAQSADKCEHRVDPYERYRSACVRARLHNGLLLNRLVAFWAARCGGQRERLHHRIRR